MGQLRSAVVPYTLSVLFIMTDGDKKAPSFDLLKIWLNEELENDLHSYFTHLLRLINDLVKKYSESDDYGEYSKREELWSRIKFSTEINQLRNSHDTQKVIEKYGIDKTVLKNRKGLNEDSENVDFKNLSDNVLIHSNGLKYYKSIQDESNLLSGSDERKLSNIIHAIINKKDIDNDLIVFESNLTNKLRVELPSFFDNVEREENSLYRTFNHLVTHYNKSINEKSDVFSEFKKIESIALAKKQKYASVYDQIGKNLSKGISPTIKQLYYASNLISDKRVSEYVPEIANISIGDVRLDELLMRKMYEWDNNARILSPKERAYIADFAWGLEKLNSFHEKNVKRHLKTLIDRGFKLE